MECADIAFPLICHFRISYFRKEKNHGWHGEYIDLVFDNSTRLHCNLKEYQNFNSTHDHIDVRDACSLQKAVLPG